MAKQLIFHSEDNEDFFLYHEGLLPDNGFYIDIGSAHAYTNSNTALLDQMGWKGICVEPNPVYQEGYKTRNCKLVQSAVFGYDGGVYFHFSPEPELSTIVSLNDRRDKKIISAISLATLVEQNGVREIDLLSIDVEGSEYEVLKPYLKTDNPKPKIIIAEFVTLGRTDFRTEKLLLKNGYQKVKQTQYNQIFIL